MDREAVWQADAAALADRVSALLTVVRSAEAEIGSLLAEIESRGVMELFGYRSVARLFEHLADVPKSAAEAVVKRARALTPSRTLDGTPMPVLAPATGAAAATGRLSTPMIDTIVGVMTQVPPEHRDDAEQHLLTFASEAAGEVPAADSPPAAAPFRLASPHRHRRITGLLAPSVPGQTPKTQAQQPPPTTAIRGMNTR